MGERKYSIIKELDEVIDSANRLSIDKEKSNETFGNTGIHIINNVSGEVKISVNIVNIYKNR